MPKINRIPAGVRADAPVDKLARAVVKERIRAALHYWERVAKCVRPRVEDIHQLRVWSRRSRAALELFSEELPAGETAELARILNKARKRAGRARDCDVLVATLDKRSRELLAEPLKAVRAKRQKSAERLHRSYRKKVKSGIIHDLMKVMQKRPNVASQNGKARFAAKFGPWFALRFESITAVFRNQLRSSRLSERKVHPLRIAAKQVRYALEIGLPAVAKESGRQLYAALEELQEHLGAICDHQALAEQYRELAKELKPKQQSHVMTLAEKHSRQARDGWTVFVRWWKSAAGRKKLARLLTLRPAPKAQRRKTQEK
jgi:CHAD domain-containing protein